MKRKLDRISSSRLILYIASGVLLLFFWKVFLLIGVLGVLLYILWQCRVQLVIACRNLCNLISRYCRKW